MQAQSWPHIQLALAPGADSNYNSSLNKPLSRIDTNIASHAPEITDDDKDKEFIIATGSTAVMRMELQILNISSR